MLQSLQLRSLSVPLWLGFLTESPGGDSGVCNNLEFPFLSPSSTPSQALALIFLLACDHLQGNVTVVLQSKRICFFPASGGMWLDSRAPWWAISQSPSTSPASSWAAYTTLTTSPELCTRESLTSRTCHSPSVWTDRCSVVNIKGSWISSPPLSHLLHLGCKWHSWVSIRHSGLEWVKNH